MISIALLLLCVSGDVDVVVPRGGGEEIRGAISRLDEDGIRLRLATESEENASDIELAWDRVADVRIGGLVQPRLPQLLERADRLFRARVRLHRGDLENAEPILELEFPPMIGRSSETALFIADGLLRCRLDRGAHADSIEPAIEYSRLRRQGISTPLDDVLVPPTTASGDADGGVQMWDAQFGLVPYLPPVWLSGPALAGAASRIQTLPALDDPELAVIADLYQRSMALQMGEDVDPIDLESSVIVDHPGALLMALMVNAVHTDGAVRKAARAMLELRPAGDPQWVADWIQFQLGRSYLMEPGAGQRRKGMLRLANLIARSSEAHPYLAGMGMAIMADEFEMMEDQDAAERLRSDLQRMIPMHPVLRATHTVPSGMTPEVEKETQ